MAGAIAITPLPPLLSGPLLPMVPVSPTAVTLKAPPTMGLAVDTLTLVILFELALIGS